MSESNDRRIDDATPDTNVTGVEKVPVSDGGTAKCLTVEQIKDFVATKFAALQNASGVVVNSDGVYIKKDGELKPVPANVFADAIISFMFGKDSETELDESDEIVINRGGTAKVATIETLAGIIKDIVSFDVLDIHEMESHTVPYALEGVEVPSSVEDDENTNERKNVKLYLPDVFTHVFSVIENFINTDQSIDRYSTEEVVIASNGGQHYGLKSVPFSQLPFGDGDVKGPSANTANKIPQWDGANSKKLKDGLNLATNITSQSGETEVPTALAVHNAVKDKANAPSSNTANRIPQWNGANSKTLKDGLELATVISESPTDGRVASEKAVFDALIDRPTYSAVNSLADQRITNSINSGGIGVALSAKVTGTKTTSISSSSTDDQIPSAKAVFNATQGADTSNLVKQPNSTTQGQIPKWSSTAKTFDYSGFSVSDVVPSYGSSSELPTTNALMKAVKRAVTVSSSQPPTGSGHEKGELLYYTYSGGNPRRDGLYINLGDASSAAWLQITPGGGVQ